MQLKLPQIDFSTLDFREIGSWPLILRGAVIGAAVIVAMILTYYLVFSKELDDLSAAQQQVADKYKEYKDQYNEAVNLDAYKKQLSDMQNAYQDYIKELPSESNIPELIDTLTKAGERNGLKFNFIKIGDPKLISGFYMSLPISLNVSGGYHNFGLFISEIGKQARIVTVGDFTIKAAESKNDPGSLTMDIESQTYWLASLAEIEKQNAGAPATKNAPSGAAGAPGKAGGVPGKPGAAGPGPGPTGAGAGPSGAPQPGAGGAAAPGGGPAGAAPGGPGRKQGGPGGRQKGAAPTPASAPQAGGG